METAKYRLIHLLTCNIMFAKILKTNESCICCSNNKQNFCEKNVTNKDTFSIARNLNICKNITLIFKSQRNYCIQIVLKLYNCVIDKESTESVHKNQSKQVILSPEYKICLTNLLVAVSTFTCAQFYHKEDQT